MLRIIWLSLLVSLVGLFVACGDNPTPAIPPAIRGNITNLNVAGGEVLGSILVEGAIENGTAFDKAAITISSQTRLFELAGQERRPVTFEALQVGQQVEAWFDGPVAESYPVQARASEVVILR
jgi:hypothetical protein